MVGETVRHWREHRALSQSILARQIGKSRSYICEVEHGNISPSLEAFLAIATALAIEPCLLLLQHGHKPPSSEQAHMSHLQHQVTALQREVETLYQRVQHPPDVS
jgi:transcriptional regulator with XRE-family HTH domain